MLRCLRSAAGNENRLLAATYLPYSTVQNFNIRHQSSLAVHSTACRSRVRELGQAWECLVTLYRAQLRCQVSSPLDLGTLHLSSQYKYTRHEGINAEGARRSKETYKNTDGNNSMEQTPSLEAARQEKARLLHNSKVHYCIHESPPLVPINPVRILPYFRSISILSAPRSSKQSPPFSFPD